MINISQSITAPIGVTTFGSAIMRVTPNVASLQFAATRLEKEPRAAFAAVHKAAKAIRSYLKQAGHGEVNSARVTLAETRRYINNAETFVGYTARAGFHLILRDLDRLEELLVGIVDAGANEISAVTLQTERLKEHRAEARRRAVAAAREKAENYCQAGGVVLGGVVHIEDVSPEILTNQTTGHHRQNVEPDDEGKAEAFDPGSIVVGAAVIVSFRLGE